MENKSLSKKILIIVFSLMIVGGVFAIIFFVGFKNESVEITDLEVKKSSIILSVGDSVDLKDYYTTKPLNLSTNVLCLSGNSVLASINDKNILTTKDVGETTIYLKVGSGSNALEENIVLRIEEVKTLPQTLSFNKSALSVMLGDTSCENKLSIFGNFNTTGKVEYSVDGICEYNLETGKITPKSVGTTIVTVRFSNNKTEISQSFSVEVKNEVEKEIILLATGLSKENDEFNLSINCGQFRKINISYFEAGVEASFEFKLTTISNTCGVSLEAERTSFSISAPNAGNAVIKIEIVGKNKFVILNFEVE